MTDSFKPTRGRRCERQLQSGDLQGHSRPIGVKATKRRSEDVDSNRLSKGQKRLLVWRKRMTKCEGEAAEFWNRSGLGQGWDFGTDDWLLLQRVWIGCLKGD
jgi:hypothetical protein